MTVPYLAQFKDRFFDVLERQEPFITSGLSILMSDMESVYNIPMLQSGEFDKNNQEVMHLYRTASKARNFEG